PAAFPGGPGLSTPPIASAIANDAVYASRESATASQRPRLHLELGALATTTTTTTPSSPPPTDTTTTTTTPPATLPPPSAGRGPFRLRPMVLQAASGPLKGEGENLTCFKKHGPAH